MHPTWRTAILLTLSTLLPFPTRAQAPVAPVFQAAPNRQAPVEVTIRHTDPQAEIHVTLDGAEPKRTDPEIDSGDTMVIDHPLTLKAKAWGPDGTAGPTATSVFTLLPAPGHHASFDDQSVPSFLATGQSARISLSLRNIGTQPWTTGYQLTPKKAKDAATWGVATLPVTQSIPTWEIATFDFVVTAPSQPGTYNFEWRLQAPDGTSFGEDSPLKRISVVTPAEYEKLLDQFTLETVPAPLAEKPAPKSPAGASPDSRPVPTVATPKATSGKPLPRLPATLARDPQVQRLHAELTRSARSFKYLRTIGFTWSDSEFSLLIERNKRVFASCRIVRRDAQGKRVIPGWPGIKLAK